MQSILPEPTVTKSLDEKCAKLTAFVSAYLASGQLDQPITVVARSAASPVVEALVQLGPELAERGIRVRAIFTTLTPDGRGGHWGAANSELPFAREIRWANHPRLTEAHEQLVVADEASWIGDCMRRDPAKRDAFEQFNGGDQNAARIAARSFEHLWRIAKPLTGTTLQG